MAVAFILAERRNKDAEACRLMIMHDGGGDVEVQKIKYNNFKVKEI